MKRSVTSICIVLAVVIGMSPAWAARKKPAPPVPLTEVGQKLEARYTQTMDALKAEIEKSLPQPGEAKQAAYQQAREAEKGAHAALGEAEKAFGSIARGRGLVGHAKGKWIGGAEKGIADTQAKLKAATTDAEREALQKELANWQKNLKDGQDALKERQALLDEALRNEPKLTKDLEAAKAGVAQAEAQTTKALAGLGLASLLGSDKLDAKLAKYVIMLEATPRGLAAFAQQGMAQEGLIGTLLEDPALMKQMLVADGAKDGKYGRAMELYTTIQKKSKKAKKGVLQRLALAVSLEHAVPRPQRSATGLTDAPPNVDPVKRYLHFEKAYLDGELDPGFKGLSVWDYRMVVNGEEPDDILAWGREMLRNYRPDHIATEDYRWRYVASVRTDIRYGSQYNKFDKPELQFFQNILMNGGVCGRRAFFGRFILRSFGIPTTARPQPGHAALTHWTPDGWVICLGGGWGIGTTKLRYKKDLDFLAHTQARAVGDKFLQVKRAQWLGDVVGEPRVFGFFAGQPEFWYGASLYLQRAIIEEAKVEALAAVGEELGEANESDVVYEVEDAALTDKDRSITVGKGGVITIPAAACSKPTKSTGKIILMNSHGGGKQLHYSRTGEAEDFEYTFNAPAAGKYALTSRVAVPSWDQHLLVAVNGAEATTDIALPLTVGLWDMTAPVVIELAKGKNVLTFSRGGENIRGMSIKEFTLKPVKM